MDFEWRQVELPSFDGLWVAPRNFERAQRYRGMRIWCSVYCPDDRGILMHEGRYVADLVFEPNRTLLVPVERSDVDG